MAELRGDLRELIHNLSEHLVDCGYKYPSACPKTAMHAHELVEFIAGQDKEMRRHLIAILREVSRPYHWGDYADLVPTARTFAPRR